MKYFFRSFYVRRVWAGIGGIYVLRIVMSWQGDYFCWNQMVRRWFRIINSSAGNYAGG